MNSWQTNKWRRKLHTNFFDKRHNFSLFRKFFLAAQWKLLLTLKFVSNKKHKRIWQLLVYIYVFIIYICITNRFLRCYCSCQVLPKRIHFSSNLPKFLHFLNFSLLFSNVFNFFYSDTYKTLPSYNQKWLYLLRQGIKLY